MKKITLLLSFCMPLIMMAQNSDKVMLGGKPSVFEQRLHNREVVDPANPEAKRLSADEQFAQWDKQAEKFASKQKDPRFLTPHQVMVQPRDYREGKFKERMDSTMVRAGKNDPNGAPMSKQEFTYSDDGKPLSCVNYIPDEETGGWNYYGEYGYEWNDEGHCIALWALNDPNEGTFKYEYIYDNGGALYNKEIYYTYENEEWVPSQMAAYSFDAAGNTTEEIYHLYDAEMGDWSQVERHTATYDEHGWTTSYFIYDWDATSGAWVGRNDANANHTWTYTDSGRDLTQIQYAWLDNDWLALSRLIYTYDDNENVTQLEWQYWNFEYQDWRGGYVNQNGSVNNNSKTLYYYDDQNRLVRQETYSRTAEQDYTTYYTYDEITYTDIEETGETEGVRCTYANLGAGIELYRRYTERHKPVASAATFYLSERKLTAGTDIMIKIDEDVRFIDDNGIYHGMETYSYTPNETNFRQGSTKEEITYDENGNQSGAHHWAGRRTGATTWVWDDRDDWNVYYVPSYDGYALAGYDRSYYSGTTKYISDGYMNTYDFSVRPENMTKWITANNSDTFRKYKYLEAYNFVNNSGVNVDLYEYTNFYFYSQTGKVEGGWNEDGTPIVIANSGAANLKAIQAPNEEFYVGWTNYGNSGYEANVQLVDVEGFATLGENGQKVGQKGPGFTSMMGMATDANSNLIVNYSDSRAYSSAWNADAYAFKLSNTTGMTQWEKALPATIDACATEAVIANGDNFYVTFKDYNDYSNHTFYVNRVNGDGELAWEESKALPGAFATFMPTGDNILMVYSQDNKVYSQVLNANFEETSRAATQISGNVEIKALPYTGNLFNCQSDGNGGMVIVFADDSYNAKYYVQHIDATGAPMLSEPYMINPDTNIDGLRYCVDTSNQRLGLFYQAGDWNGHDLHMQIVNIDGTLVLADQPITEMSNGYTVSAAKVVDNEFILAYVNTVDYSTSEQYIARINLQDGKVRGAKVGDNAITTATDAIINNDAVYYFWAYSMMDYSTYESVNEIQGVRYFLDDITDVIYEIETTGISEIIAPETQGDGKAYDIMGRPVNPETARGIIIMNGKKIYKK